MGKIVEGKWDCPYCGTKLLGGTKYHCPGCGRKRDDNTKFYLSGNDAYVTGPVNKNPDWACKFCNSLESDNAKFCGGCGAPRDAAPDYFKNHEQKAASAAEPPPPKPRLRTEFIALGVGALVLVFVLFGWLLSPKTTVATVTGFEWSRAIQIEEFKTVEETDWELPPDAHLLHSTEEIHHYDSVFSHNESKTRAVTKTRDIGTETVVVGHRDLGNGLFEEITTTRPITETYIEHETYEEPVYNQVPVYAEKYYYEIDKWVRTRAVKTSGTDKNPGWGELNLTGTEREAGRSELYKMRCEDKKSRQITVTLSEAEWLGYNVSDTVELHVFNSGEGSIVNQ